ncbi:uncharacterized protein LOC125758851 [Rhipicephalus sanguineus]|uniref:uncharacterized protein LOC125758851 n=1 Tax=Rhipicephalus sanguineus TaxID=34632 RepID=UPI0020C439D4|nr:uncharacterized protein LOC125758851 [Rhipicephalus sanguineus]
MARLLGVGVGVPEQLRPPRPPLEPLVPESKAVANDRPSSSGRRHVHVPSVPVQSPETECQGFVATNPAAEQPPTAPSKMIADHIAAQPTVTPPLEKKSGVANDHPKAVKSAPEPVLATPVQPPEPTQPDVQNLPFIAMSYQEPPIASNKKLPEQVGPAASDRVSEAQLQHSGPGPINVPVSEPQQPSSRKTILCMLMVVDFHGQ